MINYRFLSDKLVDYYGVSDSVEFTPHHIKLSLLLNDS